MSALSWLRVSVLTFLVGGPTVEVLARELRDPTQMVSQVGEAVEPPPASRLVPEDLERRILVRALGLPELHAARERQPQFTRELPYRLAGLLLDSCGRVDRLSAAIGDARHGGACQLLRCRPMPGHGFRICGNQVVVGGIE